MLRHVIRVWYPRRSEFGALTHLILEFSRYDKTTGFAIASLGAVPSFVLFQRLLGILTLLVRGDTSYSLSFVMTLHLQRLGARDASRQLALIKVLLISG